LVRAEMNSIVYSVMTTLGLPIPGKRTEKEVEVILETFMMTYAFGLNLDAAMLADVQRAKTHLEKSHSGWPQLQAFAKDVKKSVFGDAGLEFAEIVQVVLKIGEGYVQYQGKDCTRVKEELAAKPSYQDGRVLVSEVEASIKSGRRSLFTENVGDLEKLGVLDTVSDTAIQRKLIIPNYVNSQSMCLSTASFYAACCVNECEGLLARLERQVAAPLAEPALLASLIATLPGPGISASLVQELHGLADQSLGMIPLHGRALAGWMHRAFPLECPAPASQKVTNPKTPDEWMGESGSQVAELEEMMGEIADVLAKYATMGKKAPQELYVEDVSDARGDILSIHPTFVPDQIHSHWDFHHVIADILGMAFRLTAMCSMIGLVAIGTQHYSSLLATVTGKGKVVAEYGMKDYV